MKIYNLKVEDSLWRKFKTKCAAEGKSILSVITEFIQKYVGK